MLTTALYLLIMAPLILAYFVIFAAVFFVTRPFDRELRVIHAMATFWSRHMLLGMLPGWSRRVEGAENIAKGTPYVIVANHQSMVDIPLLYSLPLHFKWVSKKEVYRWPFFGIVLWMQDGIAIERGSKSSVTKMLHDGKAHIDNGVSVAVFPEGTRSKDLEIHRFKDGAFVLARHAGVGVLPCVMEGSGDLMNRGRLPWRRRFVVRVLPPVSAERVAESDPKLLAEEVRESMVEALADVRARMKKK